MSVVPVVAEVLQKAYQDKKPIAAVCIAPVILAKVLKTQNPKLTLGADGEDADNINKMGGQHQATTHEEVVTDVENRLITGPCYMLDANIGQIMRGADAVVKKLTELL